MGEIKIIKCNKCGVENPDYLNNCEKCGNNLKNNEDTNDNSSEYVDDEYHLPKNFKIISAIILVIVIIILAPLGYLAYQEFSQDEVFYDTVANVTNTEQPYKDQSFDMDKLVNQTDYVKSFYANYSSMLDEKESKLNNLRSQLSNPDYIQFTDLVIKETKIKKEAVTTMSDLVNDVEKVNKENDLSAANSMLSKQETFTRLTNESDAVANETTEFVKNHQEMKEKFNKLGLEV